MIRVQIDAHSGFCGGVIKAINAAESFLSGGGKKLFCLGSIVHNEEEVARLGAMGLVPIDLDDLETLPDMTGETLLIRAHGVPPYIYDIARKLGFRIIDCTCPVVLKLQQDIKAAYDSCKSNDKVLIFGRIGHPEVLGLVGHTDGNAIVFENENQLEDIISSGILDKADKVEFFSQTTKSPVQFAALSERLAEVCGDRLRVHQTVCSQVASRHEELATFARSHDVIVFVSGKSSSNGRVLCDLCNSANFRTYHISTLDDLQSVWFRPDDFVGVCGATSTPRWLLERVATAIENLH